MARRDGRCPSGDVASQVEVSAKRVALLASGGESIRCARKIQPHSGNQPQPGTNPCHLGVGLIGSGDNFENTVLIKKGGLDCLDTSGIGDSVPDDHTGIADSVQFSPDRAVRIIQRCPLW